MPAIATTTTKPCRHCGEAMPRDAHHNARYCSAKCNHLNHYRRHGPKQIAAYHASMPPRPVKCEQCFGPLPAKSRRTRMYCSGRCKTAAGRGMPPAPWRTCCDLCGAKLKDGSLYGRKYCDEICKSDHGNGRQPRDKGKVFHCAECGAVFSPNRVDQRFCCDRCKATSGNDAKGGRDRGWRDTVVVRECQGCGKIYDTLNYVVKNTIFCGSCSGGIQERRRKRYVRRAREYDAFVEHVTIKYLLRRDAGVCQLCGLKVCGTHPNPRSASLDHIIPLARGGEHSKSNTQLACLACNIKKGDRMPAEVA